MKYTRGPMQKSINLKITYKLWIFPSELSKKMFSCAGQGFSNSWSISPNNSYSKPNLMCLAAGETATYLLEIKSQQAHSFRRERRKKSLF